MLLVCHPYAVGTVWLKEKLKRCCKLILCIITYYSDRSPATCIILRSCVTVVHFIRVCFFCLLITIEININYCYHKWYYCIFFYLNLFYFYIYTLYHTRFVSPALYIAEQCQLSVFLQSKQVKRTPQDSINELTIWKMNLLVVPVTGFKFKSGLLHA